MHQGGSNLPKPPLKRGKRIVTMYTISSSFIRLTKTIHALNILFVKKCKLHPEIILISPFRNKKRMIPITFSNHKFQRLKVENFR